MWTIGADRGCRETRSRSVAPQAEARLEQAETVRAPIEESHVSARSRVVIQDLDRHGPQGRAVAYLAAERFCCTVQKT